MPRRCCVPQCKSNYDSTLKVKGIVTTFSFPKNEDEKAKWICAISRKEWSPSNSSVVCADHFNETDINRFEKILQSDGTYTQLKLAHPKLVSNAIPCIFPDLPHYLSKSKIAKRKDPKERPKNTIKKHFEKIEKFLQADIIEDFEDLIQQFDKNVTINTWEFKVTDFGLFLYLLEIHPTVAISIQNSIHISKEMFVKVFLKENQLSRRDLRWVLPSNLKLTKWSQIQSLLLKYI